MNYNPKDLKEEHNELVSRLQDEVLSGIGSPPPEPEIMPVPHESPECDSDRVMLRPDTLFAITINPQAQYVVTRDKKSVKNRSRLELADSHMRRLLANALWDAEYSLLYECSEPFEKKAGQEQIPRLHMHGVLVFPTTESVKDFLLYGAPILAKASIYEIDTILHVSKWNTYITKQSFLGLGGISSDLRKTPMAMIDHLQSKYFKGNDELLPELPAVKVKKQKKKLFSRK